MSYHQSRFDGVSRPLISTLPADQYVQHTTALTNSPYRNPVWWRRLLLWKKIKTIHSIEWLLGRELLIATDQQLLYQLKPETRALLTWLMRNDILAGWHFGPSVPGLPNLPTIYLDPAPILSPDGEQFVSTGANGIGCGDTYEEASLSALGEFIERLSSAGYWWEHNLPKQTYDLTNRKQVPLERFITITGEQKSNPLVPSRYLSNDDELPGTQHYWFLTRTWTGKKQYIPASTIFMQWNESQAAPPLFHEACSNGAATHSSWHEACNRAFLEYWERHVFLRYWYQKRSAHRIDINSYIDTLTSAERIKSVQSHLHETILLDITESAEQPTVILAIQKSTINEKTELHITAAADLEPIKAIDKCLKESLRFLYFCSAGTSLSLPESGVSDHHALQALATNINTRAMLWNHPDMIQFTDWCLNSDQTITATELAQKYHTHSTRYSTSPKVRYRWLQHFCTNENIDVYFADTTNSIAYYAGLHVIKAICPDLVPIFFNEALRPLTHKAFTHLDDGTRAKLNTIPHPFI